jgi:cyclopropane fatty-acyl-phospholipid synthase-like methyltransferase
LLAKANTSGTILAVDISPKSIAIASANLKHHSNVRFLVTDMVDFTSGTAFDFVVLPDVIEHIPVEQHYALFATIARHLAPTGRILINVPCPQVLEYLHVHDPSVLQLIDQPIHANGLLRDVYAAGLVLESFTTYGLQFDHAEYHSIVLRPAYKVERLARRSRWVLRWAEFRSRLPW